MAVLDVQGAARDLLHRLDVCRLSSGLNEFDLYSKDVREPVKDCCRSLAQALLEAAWQLDDKLAQKLQPLVGKVEDMTTTQPESQLDHLDDALLGLAHAVDADFQSDSRLEALECLVAQLQAAQLLAAHPPQRQEPAGESVPGKEEEEAGKDRGTPTATHLKEAEEAPENLLALARVLGCTRHPPPEQTARAKTARGVEPEASNSVRSPAQEQGAPGGGQLAARLMRDVSAALRETLAKLPEDFFRPSLERIQELNLRQASLLGHIAVDMLGDYKQRRQVAIERLCATLESLALSPRLQAEGTKGKVQEIIERVKKTLQVTPNIRLDDVFLVSPADVAAIVERGNSTAFASTAKQIVLGQVSHRGGQPRPEKPQHAGSSGARGQEAASSSAAAEGPGPVEEEEHGVERGGGRRRRAKGRSGRR